MASMTPGPPPRRFLHPARAVTGAGGSFLPAPFPHQLHRLGINPVLLHLELRVRAEVVGGLPEVGFELFDVGEGTVGGPFKRWNR